MLESLEPKFPDLNVMSLEEVEDFLYYNLLYPAIIQKMEREKFEFGKKLLEVSMEAYSIFKNAKFIIDEDREIQIENEISSLAYSIGYRYENGNFWQASYC